MSVAMEDWPRRHRVTVDEYHRMAEVGVLAPDARVELIEGEIIEMPPIGNPHAATVDRLVELLHSAVGKRAIVRCQGPIQLGDLSETQPDFALLVRREDFYENNRPTPLRDRERSGALLRDPGPDLRRVRLMLPSPNHATRPTEQSMIAHTSLAVSNYPKSKAFYLKALAPLGYSNNMEYGEAAGFNDGKNTDFWIGRKDEVVPTHIAFEAHSKQEVEAFYKAALAAGGKDNGGPGIAITGRATTPRSSTTSTATMSKQSGTTTRRRSKARPSNSKLFHTGTHAAPATRRVADRVSRNSAGQYIAFFDVENPAQKAKASLPVTEATLTGSKAVMPERIVRPDRPWERSRESSCPGRRRTRSPSLRRAARTAVSRSTDRCPRPGDRTQPERENATPAAATTRREPPDPRCFPHADPLRETPQSHAGALRTRCAPTLP